MKMITALPPVMRQMVLITATTFVFPISQSLAEPDTGLIWPNSQTTETTPNAVLTETPAEALDITGNLGGETSAVGQTTDDGLITYSDETASGQVSSDETITP